ncbi:cytochrome P450 [Artomyces pyxidatus]|uniref:Cytochrome P450 n=1 Tax=Artomyces pyxidatus TaxID=48021 RepID=A0ACB8T837_9AGAM|nr:cytochrome P450 [Artomyces pyxidatus]
MFDALNWSLLLKGTLLLFLVSVVVKLFNGIKIVAGVPGIYIPFQPISLPGVVIPTCWWNPGLSWVWRYRLNSYQSYQSAVLCFVPFLSGSPSFFTNSVEVARQVVGGGVESPWIKARVSASRGFTPWGMNLLSSEKETWRRHRGIMGPAFNTITYSLVWYETIRVYRDMVFCEGWDLKDTVDIPAVQDYTLKLALFVISASGFGWPFSWDEEPVNEDGTMGIQKAFKIYLENKVTLVLAPRWIYKLPFQRLREIHAARQVLRKYRSKLIEERKAEIHGTLDKEFPTFGRKDVFSLLVRANEEDEKLKLDDSELVGNVLGLLFAGHETTAHALAATLGLLGVYQDVQQAAYQEIIDVVGKDRNPLFSDFTKLEKVRSIFYESLRLYPSGYIMVREALEDTIIDIPTDAGKRATRPIPVPKGTQVVVDLVGIQYNPKYYPDPDKFDPSRWQGVSEDSEAVTAFSVGPRACIGRKFATMEAVCFLILLLRDWNIAPILQTGETHEQWRERVMQAEAKSTLGLRSFPLRLTRRR